MKLKSTQRKIVSFQYWLDMSLRHLSIGQQYEQADSEIVKRCNSTRHAAVAVP